MRRACGLPAGTTPRFAQAAHVTTCTGCGGWSWRGEAPPAEELYDERYFTGGEYFGYEQSRRVHVKNFERKLDIGEMEG